MSELDYKYLLEMAMNARENAYSPYSNYKVGATLITYNNKIFSGCNIENSSFSPTICAERLAIYKAVSENEKKFKAIAVICDSKDICKPCGVCLQVMNEFFDNSTQIILGNLKGLYEIFSINDLLPHPFNIKGIKEQ
jgi:cytidine deaminase